MNLFQIDPESESELSSTVEFTIRFLQRVTFQLASGSTLNRISAFSFFSRSVTNSLLKSAFIYLFIAIFCIKQLPAACINNSDDNSESQIKQSSWQQHNQNKELKDVLKKS